MTHEGCERPRTVSFDPDVTRERPPGAPPLRPGAREPMNTDASPAGDASSTPAYSDAQTPSVLIFARRTESMSYWQRLRGNRGKGSGVLAGDMWELLLMLVLSCLAMTTLALLHIYVAIPMGGISFSLVIPPFGASCALVFGAPKVPAAQPKSVFLGHAIGALAGLVMGHAFATVRNGTPLAAALAIGITVALTTFLSVPHPPASATAFVAAAAVPLHLLGASFIFLVFPVLSGCIVLFLVAWLGNNLLSSRSPYPEYWW